MDYSLPVPKSTECYWDVNIILCRDYSLMTVFIAKVAQDVKQI